MDNSFGWVLILSREVTSEERLHWYHQQDASFSCEGGGGLEDGILFLNVCNV